METTPPATDAAESSNAGEDDEEEYEIDYIVNSRWRTTRGEKYFEYLIHWTGYGVEDRSWTDASQFEDDDPPVVKFHKQNPSKPKRTTAIVTNTTKSTVTAMKNGPATPITNNTPSASPKSSPPLKPAQKKLGGVADLRAFFGKAPAAGKENKPEVSVEGKEKAAVVKTVKKAVLASTKPPVTKKRKVHPDEDDDDFQMDEDVKSEDDDEVDGEDEDMAEDALASASEEDEEDISKLRYLVSVPWSKLMSSRYETVKEVRRWKLESQGGQESGQAVRPPSSSIQA